MLITFVHYNFKSLLYVLLICRGVHKFNPLLKFSTLAHSTYRFDVQFFDAGSYSTLGSFEVQFLRSSRIRRWVVFAVQSFDVELFDIQWFDVQ
jgi:hypothetical protein